MCGFYDVTKATPWTPKALIGVSDTDTDMGSGTDTEAFTAPTYSLRSRVKEQVLGHVPSITVPVQKA